VLQIAAKPLQIATQFLLTAYKNLLLTLIQWYHRRPPTTYRLATVGLPNVIDDTKTTVKSDNIRQRHQTKLKREIFTDTVYYTGRPSSEYY